jgi:GntR family transcriptional regulator, transcriptional repressor for pyruvate dehydrogenase complex
MKVEPVSRTSLSDAVFRELRARILGGQLPADATLPAERELCAAFGVNRNALREALKRLEQLGLVQIRQGDATRVVDFRAEGGLELLPAFLVGPDVKLRRRAVRGLFELRSVIGPDVARRAAERRTLADADALEALVARMIEASKPPELQRLSMALWERLARASDNLAYQCTYNSMRKAWGPVQDAAAFAIMDEIGDRARYQKLVKAVREEQPERAAKVARELLDAGFQGLTRFLGGLG